MDEELEKLTAEVQAWIRATAERLHAEQKYQHASRTFGTRSIVLIMDRNKTHGNWELTAYEVDSAQLESHLFGSCPSLFVEQEPTP